MANFSLDKKEERLRKIGHIVTCFWPHCANKDKIYTEHGLCIPIYREM